MNKISACVLVLLLAVEACLALQCYTCGEKTQSCKTLTAPVKCGNIIGRDTVCSITVKNDQVVERKCDGVPKEQRDGCGVTGDTTTCICRADLCNADCHQCTKKEEKGKSKGAVFTLSCSAVLALTASYLFTKLLWH